jgi:hypothetical protein
MFLYLLPHEHIVKNGRPVTSTNCYETMKNASILMKLGTNNNWTIASVTACSIVKCLLPWQRGMSKNANNNYLTLFFFFFFHQSAATSQCVTLFSVGY